MEEHWLADRQRLQHLLDAHPEWTRQDLDDATGRSLGWVKKWLRRLRGASASDPCVLLSRSCARKTPPSRLSDAVIARILDIRDHPPLNLGRIPGPKAILYYLSLETDTALAGERIPRSTRTIWLILRQHQRIVLTPSHSRHPVERSEPLTDWQLDFKDASTVPPEADGKRQHVIEVLDIVDTGTSLLLDAQPRADFTMATTIAAVAQTVREIGLPERITVDRDARFVGGTRYTDTPAPFLRFWLCLGVAVNVLPPHRPDLNAFVERYHRSYSEECLDVYRPGDLDSVVNVTAHFRQHYNEERPHQGLSCGNQPPRKAFPDLPPRPPVPALVDPGRWIDALDGKRFVRKVYRDTSVKLDAQRYYVSSKLVGQQVTLIISAADRTLRVEHEGKEVRRLRLHGSGQPACSFEQFVEQLCQEARTGQRGIAPAAKQLALNL